ncbi:MAG: PAS domain S-box protein [Alphaproteobacteria bacterium]|nr:PAS domain S-box protein [Alphaproteobacteria bacterium]
MNDVESSNEDDSGILRRQIECVGQLAASTVLVEQGLDAALREITEVAARALNVDRISLWQHDTSDLEAACLAAYDRGPQRHKQGAVLQLAQHHTYLGELKRLHVLAINDTSLDQRAADIRRDTLEPKGIKALLLVSIRREGQFIGSMAYSKFSGPHHWTAEEQAFAGVFAEFVSRNLETHERRNTETAFRDFANAGSDWSWETDTEHRFTYVSDRFYQLTGETPNDVIGKTRTESRREIDDPVLAGEFSRNLAEHKAFRDAINVRSFPDGKQQWYRISGVPVFDEAGEFKGYRGVGTDATEHIRMERALKEREVNFSALVEAAPLPITVTVDNKYVYGNTLAHELLGVSEEEFAGMDARLIYVRQDDRKPIVAELEAQGQIRNHEVFLQRRDGATFWASLNANIADFQGNRAYITGFTDITERKTAQEELARTAALLEAILDAVPGGLAYRDLDGRIQFMNKQGAALFDRPANEFIGNTLTEMFGEVDGTTSETLVSQVIETGQPILNYENTPPRIAGRTFNYSIVPVEDQNGAMVGIVTATDEITARKQADDQLRRSEAKFRSVVENSIQGVCIEREKKLLFANQALADIFGYQTPEEVLALKSADDLLSPDAALQLRNSGDKQL